MTQKLRGNNLLTLANNGRESGKYSLLHKSQRQQILEDLGGFGKIDLGGFGRICEGLGVGWVDLGAFWVDWGGLGWIVGGF